ncbi:hypothetical protein B0H19DRAFT_1153793 [Mycena capillaripes]|nr:hypothetical protein B0H19DRAFT_1153793 [Mycena capillaripes]
MIQIGTKTQYTLDLDDIMAFPDNNTIPVHPPAPDERWVIITEVLSNPAPRSGGHGFMVKDKNGDRFPVVFSTRNVAKDVQQSLGAYYAWPMAAYWIFGPTWGISCETSPVPTFFLVLCFLKHWLIIVISRCCHAPSQRCVGYPPVCEQKVMQASLVDAATFARRARVSIAVAVERGIVERFAHSGFYVSRLISLCLGMSAHRLEQRTL